MVNSAEQGEVTVLESYEDVIAFVQGEDTGRTVEVEEDGLSGASGEPSDTPKNETPEEQPAQSSTSQSPADVSNMSEEELIRVIREAANELESRKEE
jgi:hypothetical protein